MGMVFSMLALIPWVRVHKAPDYVYFNHAVHVNRGISCVECHGKVDQMVEVHHDKHLSMAFCLDRHRNPEKLSVHWTRLLTCPGKPKAMAMLTL